MRVELSFETHDRGWTFTLSGERHTQRLTEGEIAALFQALPVATCPRDVAERIAQRVLDEVRRQKGG